jgi:hypothetical protein
MTIPSRREFLRDVGRGMLAASVGFAAGEELGLFPRAFGGEGDALSFGALEPLVAFMQETAIGGFLPALAERLRSGTRLEDLLAAGALANARTFGGEDYVGFHTLMALAPSYHMARELPTERSALPVFKVLYRNTNRIQEHGGRKNEVLHPVAPQPVPAGAKGADALREAVRRKDDAAAEGIFASLTSSDPEAAWNDLLITVQDAAEVHRVVLPYRAWDLLRLIGMEHAQALLRQSLRYCLKSEKQTNYPESLKEPRSVLPNLLEKHRLLDRMPGKREADDAWIDSTSRAIFAATPADAAGLVASALADGMSPAALGEALSLAANQLVLRDHGRRETEVQAYKPAGSVHGDSIGVHACDSANAWRNMARAANARNTFASLIEGAWQVALDRVQRGGDFLNWEPHPRPELLEKVKAASPEDLLKEADGAIRENDQARAAAIVHRYGELGHPPRQVFDLLLRYAVSEDGALHAEKYYRTVAEEFASTRPAFRWRQLTALARVTASEFGKPAAGYEEARALLKV